ncbi:hypothetical protein AOC36_06065 [Erysipelothrix larvae]|uniref:SAM-dependent methyltransferase n=1 Tax=Erysipelothrix larvae TaxID=1514105 RepID=A0A0X8H008_9FIRM|nr:hypothetical protein [Erysipelothrix larvae]AMC93563.1 hypothetical protein AOC36_06065 [Erysipelothrix larvae]
MFREIESYALEHNVPIMSSESIDFISTILADTHSRSLLEVGTAIAYSTLNFAHRIDGLLIDTIERDDVRYEEAIKNVKKFSCGSRIHTIHHDALKYRNIKHYDAILLDAAKAQNEAMFKLYFAFVDKVMIIDNIDFHGFTGHSQEIRSRNLRQMIQRIESFLTYINSRSDLSVERYDIGDGLMVIKRKSTQG